MIKEELIIELLSIEMFEIRQYKGFFNDKSETVTLLYLKQSCGLIYLQPFESDKIFWLKETWEFNSKGILRPNLKKITTEKLLESGWIISLDLKNKIIFNLNIFKNC